MTGWCSSTRRTSSCIGSHWTAANRQQSCPRPMKSAVTAIWSGLADGCWRSKKATPSIRCNTGWWRLPSTASARYWPKARTSTPHQPSAQTASAWPGSNGAGQTSPGPRPGCMSARGLASRAALPATARRSRCSNRVSTPMADCSVCLTATATGSRGLKSTATGKRCLPLPPTMPPRPGNSAPAPGARCRTVTSPPGSKTASPAWARKHTMAKHSHSPATGAAFAASTWTPSTITPLPPQR